ncbi:DsbA family protein [Modestobacter altitudinis]|uniref:DsbA family protein n=1 Tax=Modestobacter altitudinis TaxID=2213158 RepID=UPI00110D03FF|nr:thioredoxin domain-containing protein [Modestobacter altitudinis]
MKTNYKISAALVAVFGLVVAGFLAFGGDESDTSADGNAAGGTTPVVRDDSHRLGEPGSGEVTFVEFLDFECESCRAAYPTVEQLREDYAGRVTFVARYFPLPGHANAENAAVAVEAAAQQGAFEAMYQRMYETQAEWGEQQVSQADLFRSFAEEMGLDMAAYDAAVADPATLERVLSDRDDGLALGVEGTPTFFLNGERLEVASAQELIKAVDAAVNE